MLGLFGTSSMPLLVGITFAVSLIIVVQQYRIANLKAELEEKNTESIVLKYNVKTLTDQKLELIGAIEEQNKAVKEANDRLISLQITLDKAVGLNTSLYKENVKIKSDIINRPLAKDCASAVEELKSTSSRVSEKWNAK